MAHQVIVGFGHTPNQLEQSLNARLAAFDRLKIVSTEYNAVWDKDAERILYSAMLVVEVEEKGPQPQVW